MTLLHRSELDRASLLRRVGRLEQTFGVRLVTLGDGLGRGVRVLEFDSGSGFHFETLCLELFTPSVGCNMRHARHQMRR